MATQKLSADQLNAPLGRYWPIDVPPTSPDTMDDEFNGSSLDAKWTLTYATTNPPVLTWLGKELMVDYQAQAGWLLQGFTQPLPASGDWEFTLGVAALDGSLLNYNVPAILGLAEGATAGDLTKKVKAIGMARFNQSKNAIEMIDLQRWTDSTGAAFNDSDQQHHGDGYLRVKKVGSTYSFWYSVTGKRFYDFYNSTLSFTPGRIVVGGKTEHTTPLAQPIGIYKWFRRTA